MVDLAVREEDWSAADSLFRLQDPDWQRPPYSDAVEAAATGDTAALRAARAKLREGEPWLSVAAAGLIAIPLERYDIAEQFLRDAAPRARGAQRATAHALLAQLALGGGRWNQFDTDLDDAARYDPESARRHGMLRATCAVLPFLPVPRGDLLAIREEVAGWDSLPPAGPDLPLATYFRPHARLYALGLLSARLEESGRALEYAAALEATPAPPAWPAVPGVMAAGVRAYAALLEDRPTDALAALEAVDGNLPLDLHASPVLSQGLERLVRAEALLRLGRAEEAQRWFANSFVHSPLERVLRAPAHLRQAEAYDALGNAEKAIEHYDRFLDLWQNADPDAQPLVRAARARLERLTRERAGAE